MSEPCRVPGASTLLTCESQTAINFLADLRSEDWSFALSLVRVQPSYKKTLFRVVEALISRLLEHLTIFDPPST
jgi:hypothetical protein